MSLSPLDIQNKTFQKKKFGGFDPDEVDDFLDQVVRDYEELTQKNRELDKDLKHAKEKLGYFDELKDSLNESIIVAQDTANKVKSNASNEADVIVKSANQQAEETVNSAQAKADRILEEAKQKASDMLQDAANNAKTLASETEDLKKKTRGFHQRLSLMLESQLQTVKSTEWDDLLKPFSSYVDDHQTVLKEVLEKAETPADGEEGMEVAKETEAAETSFEGSEEHSDNSEGHVVAQEVPVEEGASEEVPSEQVSPEENGEGQQEEHHEGEQQDSPSEHHEG